ncbi:MAG: CheR family methyltransferase, partial [Planctomycetota bacterium]
MHNINLSQSEFELLRSLVTELTGVTISDEKSYLVATRLGPMLEKWGCRSFYDLYYKAKRGLDNDIRDKIIDAMTTKETLWFRDNVHFSVLQESILPKLCDDFESARRFFPVTIWSAACSTGQEPYSIA